VAESGKFAQILQYGLIDIGQRKIQDKLLTFALNLCAKVEKLMVVQHTQQQVGPSLAGKEQLPEEGTPRAIASQVPSFVILQLIIKGFLPLSLKEPNTQKMRALFKLLNKIFSETDVYKSLEKIEAP
jgi:hypothetical protein